MKLSIRWVLIVGSLVLVWGTHLIITPSSYLSSQRIMLKHARDIMENISDLTMSETGNYLFLAQSAAHLTKRLMATDVVSSDEYNIKNLENYFYDQLAIYPHFSGIYWGNPDGNFFYVSRNSQKSPQGFRTKIINNQPTRKTRIIWRNKDLEVVERESATEDTYDPRQRPWYIDAEKEEQIVWTDPYVFFTSKKPGLTIAGPTYHQDGTLKGIVGVDIELDELSNFISRLRVGKSGQAFMLNRNNDIIAFPDPKQLQYTSLDNPDKIRLPKIHELKNPLFQNAYNSIPWQKDAQGNISLKQAEFATFSHNGQSYLAMFAPFIEQKLPWLIGIVVPEDDYLGEIKENKKLNTLLTVVISLLATLAGILLAKSIIRPVAELEQEALAIKNNNFMPAPKIQSIYPELQNSADSFTAMKKAITSYKKELREKEKTYRVITNTANDAIIMLDANGNVLFWNPAAEKIFGYTENEIMGRDLHAILTPSTELGPIPDGFYLFLQGDKQQYAGKTIEATVINKNQKKICVELSLANLEIDKNWHVIAVIRDISARKKTEMEKEAAQIRLQHTNKMEAIGTLAGGIAHDFNNILAAIIGFADLVKHALPTDSEPQKDIKQIIKAGHRAKDLVRQIMMFSRKSELEQQPLHTVSLVNEAIQMLRASIPSTIKIKSNIALDTFPIIADPTKIHQVMMNLCTNAYHATRENKGSISISLENTVFSENFSQAIKKLPSGNYIMLTVSDTGHGFDNTVKNRIFEPYFTTKGNGEGSGMGLAMVHGIIAELKGSISVESVIGRGTEFKIYLPACESEDIAIEHNEDISDISGNEKILFIDDELPQVQLFTKALEKLGYQVTGMTNSVEALELFNDRAEKFDIIITDLSMANMTGIELAQKIHTNHPSIPIIIVTGFAQDYSRKEIEQLGISDLLLKPIEPYKLAKTIRTTLDTQKKEINMNIEN